MGLRRPGWPVCFCLGNMLNVFTGPTREYEKDHPATLYFSQVTRFELVGALIEGL